MERMAIIVLVVHIATLARVIAGEGGQPVTAQAVSTTSYFPGTL